MSNRATKMVGAGLAPSAANQIAGDVQLAVTAAGTTQATATAVYGDNVQITTCPASAGVVLSGPAIGPGDDVFVYNGGANACLIYPPIGSNAQINALAANAGFSLASATSVLIRCVSATQFYTR